MGLDQDRRRLVRRTDQKVIGGVCAGLADHFSLDVTLIRIAFVALALLGFGGVLVYLVAWLLIPASGSPPRLEGERRRSLWSALLLLTLGAIILMPLFLAVIQAGTFMGPNAVFQLAPQPLVLGIVLILVGAALLVSHDRQQDEEVEQAIEETLVPLSSARWSIATSQTPRVKRQGSALLPFTLAITSLAVGGAALLSTMELVDLDIGQIAALALLLVGLGLIIGAWWGRARLLILLGILMVPPVLLASVIDVPLTGRFGSVYLMPESADQLEDLRFTAGNISLDLNDFRFTPGATQTLSIEIGAGNVSIYVPRDVYMRADVVAAIGEVSVGARNDAGSDIAVSTSAGPEGSDKRLMLDITGGLASIHIHRYAHLEQPPDARRERDRVDQEGNKTRFQGKRHR